VQKVKQNIKMCWSYFVSSLVSIVFQKFTENEHRRRILKIENIADIIGIADIGIADIFS